MFLFPFLVLFIHIVEVISFVPNWRIDSNFTTVFISSVWSSVICQLDAYYLLLAFLFCLGLTLISTTHWDFVSNLSHIIPSHFYLQMLNDINVKNSWDSLRWKYQLKQIMRTRGKKCCNQWKLHSEKNKPKVSKP